MTFTTDRPTEIAGKVNRLSDELHLRVLGRLPYDITKAQLKEAQHHWALHNLTDATDDRPIVNLPIPKGVGTYQQVADAAVELYGRSIFSKLESLLELQVELPYRKAPKTSGWHRLAHEQPSCWQSCDAPSDRALVLDFETVDVNLEVDFDDDNNAIVKKPDWRPFLCVAVDSEYWYFWLADMTKELPTVAPFNGDNLIVGHNVSYDRSYLATEYTRQESGNNFFDTMAAWIAVRGFTNQQRSIIKASEKTKVAVNDSEDDDYYSFQALTQPAWVDQTTTQSLKSLYEFYYPEETLDKAARDLWVKQGTSYLRSNMDTVIEYAFKDVWVTLKVFQAVYPELMRSQPSKISTLAQVMLGNTWLPLSDRWENYYETAEAKTREILDGIEADLEKLALEVLDKPTEHQLLVLDWTPAKTGKNKGLPKWYRDCKGRPSIGSRVAVTLLGVTYMNEIVRWQQETSNTGYYYTTSFGKLPHPEKAGKNLSNIFCKGNVSLFENGVFKTATDGAAKMVSDKVSTLNWVSLRERISQVHIERPEGYIVTLPQIVVTGTVTRRGADNLWLVASNPKEKRIGTELKSMIAPPEGYSIVGADVASEELWIASALGDATIGFNGATALGLSVLIGDKKNGTDPHSLVATAQGIVRDLAKNIVYGICYGLGLKGCSDYLRKSNMLLSEVTAKANAMALLAQVKGRKSPIDGSYIDGMGSLSFNRMEAIAKSKVPTTPVLKAKISRCLQGHSDFTTTKVNWVVQSSGSDFRDLLVLYTKYFMDLLKVDGRMLLFIHDESRWLVRNEHIKRATYAFQLAHLYTRAYFIDALGLDALPAGESLFPEVDVDPYCLRKDTQAPQVTPSQPEAIAPGYVYTPSDVLSWFEK